MYTAFDFDEYWYQFTESPDPEFFDPVVDILFPGDFEELNDISEQLSLF